MEKNPNKAVIVGAGMVGAAVLGALLGDNLLSEIVLIDQNRDRAAGEALDASHTTAFAYSARAQVRAGDYADCADAGIVVMTAGPSIKPGETPDRLKLAGQNTQITREVMGQITRYTREAILIAVTNPVDIVTYCAQAEFDYPRERVIGTGTLLDTARLRQMIAASCHVDGKNVHGYVLGEHGGGAFVPWGLVDVAGVPVDKLHTAFDLPAPLNREDLLEKTKAAGFEIISRKGYTSAGIAASVARVVKGILLDERCILPLSTAQNGACGLSGVALSLPSILGKNGVEQVIEVPLQPGERDQLQQCAAHLKATLGQAGL